MKLLANQLGVSKPSRIPEPKGRSTHILTRELADSSIISGNSVSTADKETRKQSYSHMAMVVSTALVHCGGIFTEPHLSLAALPAFTQQKKQFTPRRRRERGPPWS